MPQSDAPMTEELRAIIERLCHQPADVQHHVADLVNEVLDEQGQDEVDATPEELAAIEQAKAQIASGDYVTLDELMRDLDAREQQR